MKILVIGSGGREHAVIKSLSRSPKVTELHAAPGNGGIASLATCHAVNATDIDGVIALSKSLSVDLVFVTPDDPLVLGMVDALEIAGIRAFGPHKNAAILEGSKSFSKAFMARHNIPTADYKAFVGAEQADDAVAYIKAQNSYPAVIKYDGLALGKGVIIAENEGEAIDAIRSMLVDGKFSGGSSDSSVSKDKPSIVIEEYLDGVEVTVLAFTDGKVIVPMPASTDHKRAFDGDKGPNTGGMGVVTGVPYYTDAVATECMELIFLPTIKGMTSESRAFKGCLYFGLMLTKSGVKVIEYNCRFGDPEAQAVLPLLGNDCDLLEIVEAIIDERLGEISVKFADKKAACVVMASGGYPEKYQTGFTITGITECEQSGCEVFHAGTKLTGELVTSGGRVLAVTAVADELKSALDLAYAGIAKIKFENAHHRRDIGIKATLT
ncbi:MAG: phosphoribosylamine--glycine ligase [Oscillospiraceae bacterium]|nr:phosphoribosylamine--glycine ligase [Oscillospiraceae bacterium]